MFKPRVESATFQIVAELRYLSPAFDYVVPSLCFITLLIMYSLEWSRFLTAGVEMAFLIYIPALASVRKPVE
jgi:hypothetical protein